MMREGGAQKMLNEYSAPRWTNITIVNVNEYKPLHVNEYIR